MNTCVFVIGLTGKRLMPTSPAKARKLLKEKKAKIYSKRPFTIQLLYKTGSTTQEVTVGVDTGTQHIGVAVVSKGRVLYKSEIILRDTMEKRKLLETRKTYRKGRRYRKTRYRHPKFRFRTKRVYQEELITRKSTGHLTHWKKIPPSVDSNRPEGWLPPSIQSKIDHHIAWINRYMDILPQGTKLRIEVGRFDMARMKDPTIHNELYQQGPQYDYENMKAYIFARDNYTCQCCGAKAGANRKDGSVVKLIAHHIDFRSKGSTDNPERIATVCDKCHTGRNHEPGGILYQWMEEGKTFSRGYRDPSHMNIIRKRMFAYYPDAEFTYGNITAADRKRLKLEKSHAGDAVAIAVGSSELVQNNTAVICYRQVRKKKRSLHEANPRKGRKEPNRDAKRNPKNMKESKGFHLWDKVQVDGKTGWISGFSSRGSAARVVDKDMHFIAKEGKNYSTHQLSTLTCLKHNNNWIAFQE